MPRIGTRQTMIGLGYWIRLIFLQVLIKGVCCCVSDGDFDCASKWYFWFGLFWGCIVLFIGIIIMYNKLFKTNRIFCSPKSKARRSRKKPSWKMHQGSVADSSILSSNVSQATESNTLAASNGKPTDIFPPWHTFRATSKRELVVPPPTQAMDNGLRPDDEIHQAKTNDQYETKTVPHPDSASPVLETVKIKS